MMWAKKIIFVLLVSFLVPILQARADDCVDACTTGCTQSCLDTVTNLCMAQNPTFPPFICKSHPGYQPQRNLCSDFSVPSQNACRTSCEADNCSADVTEPLITSIERLTPSTEDTNADTLVWRITFSEAVQNVGERGVFTVMGTNREVVTAVSAVTDKSFDVTVSGGNLADLTGTVTLGLDSKASITDLVGNRLNDTTPTGNNNNSFAVDNTIPTIAISSSDANLANGETATITFTISEDVSDFVVDDITVLGGFLSDFTTVSASKYTAIYTARISTSSVSVASGVFSDAAGNSNIDGADANNSVAQTQDLVAPTLQAGALSQCEQDGKNLCNQPCIEAVPTVQECLVLNPDFPPPVCIIKFNSDVSACESEVTTVEAACETAYNTTNSCPVADSGIERLTPSTEATNADALVWRITFDESVKNVDSSDFAVTATTATISVSADTGSSFDVTASGGDLADLTSTVALSFAGAQNIADTAGNALVDTNLTGNNNNSFIIDNTKPTVAITGVSTNSNAAFTATITFSEAVTGFVVGDITASNANVSVFAGSGTTYTATVTPIAIGTNVVISVAAGVAMDAATNANTAATNVTVITNSIGVVTISGAAVEGASLSAGVSDADGVNGSVFTYQWKSNNTNVGTNQSTYELQTSDVGKTITVQVAYTDQLSTVENITSAATASVASVVSNALDTISDVINNGGGLGLTVDDYKAAGVVNFIKEEDLTRLLSILNYAISQQTAATDVDELSEIEALIATIMLGQDDDSDGLPNLVEGNADTDGDGKSDDKDNDADNDGIADWLEHGLAMDDTDSDGIIDALDADVDGDGTVEAGKLDANLDGVDDNLDSLAELLANDANLNRDSDGQVNYLDLDSDNDGAFDVLEAGLVDIDYNGLVDAGTALIVDEANLPNTNADNTPNIFALISDGTSRDLIVYGFPETLDVNEDGKLDSTVDMDKDGLIDIVDGAVGAFGSFKDFDDDGIPNHLDPDDDNDGILDIIENPRQADFTGLDADADGIDDGVDYEVNGKFVGVDADGNGVQDDKEMPDADNDGIADHLDNDSDNDGVTDDKDASVNTGDDYKTSAGAGSMTPLLIFVLFGVLFARLCSRKRLVLVGLLMSMSQAQAGGIGIGGQWEVGLGIGHSSFAPELAAGLTLTADADTAMQISLAYVFNERWLAELRYADLGKAKVNSAATVGHEVVAMNVQYTLPKRPIEKMSLYVLAGVGVIDLAGSNGFNIENESSTELSVGIGTRYHFSDHWLVRVELASYNANSSAIMLSSHYRF